MLFRQALQLRAQSQKHQRRMLDAKQQGDALGRIERIRVAKPGASPMLLSRMLLGPKSCSQLRAVT